LIYVELILRLYVTNQNQPIELSLEQSLEFWVIDNLVSNLFKVPIYNNTTSFFCLAINVIFYGFFIDFIFLSLKDRYILTLF
jgi:hypothetical protein